MVRVSRVAYNLLAWDQAGLAGLMGPHSHADALTFDKGSQTGGANGSVTTERELNEHAANKGLVRAVDELQQIRAGPCPQLTIPGL